MPASAPDNMSTFDLDRFNFWVVTDYIGSCGSIAVVTGCDVNAYVVDAIVAYFINC